MGRDPAVIIPLSEHDDLLRAAGLEHGKHGLSDLKRLVRQYGYLLQAIVDSDYGPPKRVLKAHTDAITETKVREKT